MLERTARRHGHAPQHHRVPRHQASRAQHVCPTHFSGQDLRRGTRQPLPIADHLSFGEPSDDADDPYSLPHMAGLHCHEPQWQQSPMDVRSVHVSQEFLPSTGKRNHGRVPAARQSLYETLQGRAGPILGTLRGREIQHHSPHALDPRRGAGDRHDASAWSDIVCTDAERADVRPLATARHIAGTLFKHHRGHSAPELRAGADMGEADGGLVHEDPPDVYPDLFEEEDDEPELPEHEVPKPEDVRKEAPIPVLNRFLALRIVYGDGLRRTPSVG